MTTWNAMPHVVQAARSIVAQTCADWELLVVDDGSTDGTLDALRAVGDPRLRILQIPRCGRIPSLNHGFRAARAPLVAVLDADDVALPDRLALQVAEMRRRPGLAALSSPRTRPSELAASNGARLGFPARSQISALVDGATRATQHASRNAGPAVNCQTTHSFLMELGFFPAPATAAGWRSTAAIATFSLAPEWFGASATTTKG